MQELKTEELKTVDGGFEIGLGVLAILSLGIPFVVGVIDGLVRPLQCN